MKRNAIEADLSNAREALKQLQDELPNFHSLLTENERDARRLKESKASLDAQSQARGRVQIAQEMLEQHHSDIAAAQVEVNRLEALKQREQKLAQMAKAAETAKAHREAMDTAFSNATKAMHHAAELLLREWTGEHEARRQFAQVGAELVPGFNSLSDPDYAGMTSDQKLRFEEGRKVLLAELRECGVPLDYATDGATGRHSSLDKYAERELPRDELSMAIWQAFLILAGPEAQQFARFVPKPKQPISFR